MSPDQFDRIRSAVHSFEQDMPVSKHGHQFLGRTPAEFHTFVVTMILDRDDQLSQIPTDELRDGVGRAYEMSKAMDPASYAYAGSIACEAPATIDPAALNYKPAPGYFYATLYAHLPMRDEPVESICMVNASGEVLPSHESRIEEWLDGCSRPENELGVYSIKDRHGNSYPVLVRRADEELTQLEVKDPAKFVRCQSMNKEQLVTDYRGAIDTLLAKHFDLGINDTLLADERRIEQYLGEGLQAFEAVNMAVEDEALIRVDAPVGNNPLLTSNDQADALRVAHEFESCSQAVSAVMVGYAGANRMRTGDAVVVGPESLVGIVGEYGVICITDNTGEGLLDAAEDESVWQGIDADQIEFAADQARVIGAGIDSRVRDALDMDSNCPALMRM